MSAKEEIISFFEKYTDEFQGDGGSGTYLKLHHFEITPRDFLDFAEKDFETSLSTHSLVNATSNLKRAVDCQIDSLLLTMNLDDFYRKKRLGVDRKLGFLEKSGLFRSRSIEKLNHLRNRLEHHYELPKIEDVEVYYDLVVAFVTVLEGVMPLIATNSNLGMTLESGGYISTTYDRDTPTISIHLKHDLSDYENTLECSLDSNSSDIETLLEFAFFFKVHHALRLYDQGVSSKKHILKLLKS